MKKNSLIDSKINFLLESVYVTPKKNRVIIKKKKKNNYTKRKKKNDDENMRCENEGKRSVSLIKRCSSGCVHSQVIMGDRPAAERACKDPNPIIDGRKANVNLAILGAKPRGNLQTGEFLLLFIFVNENRMKLYNCQLKLSCLNFFFFPKLQHCHTF